MHSISWKLEGWRRNAGLGVNYNVNQPSFKINFGIYCNHIVDLLNTVISAESGEELSGLLQDLAAASHTRPEILTHFQVTPYR